MKKQNTILSIIALLISVMTIMSCGKNAKWTTDFDAALKNAQKKQKEILLYFTGSDWDGKSPDQKLNILETKTFLDAASKKYILVCIDYPSQQTEENAAQAEIANTLTSKYSIQSIPTILLLTKEGYVITDASVSDDTTTPETYLTFLSTLDEKVKSYNDAIKKIESSSGIEKVTSIDELFSITEAAYSGLLGDYAEQVCELDKENTTGLLGKYLIQQAYTHSVDALTSGNTAVAVEEFTKIADNSLLTVSEKQEAWYYAAYLSAMIGAPVETQIDYLQKCIDVDPSSETALYMLNIISNLELQASNSTSENLSETGTDAAGSSGVNE